MATVKNSIPHVVRTAHERRYSGTWIATLSKIEHINSTIRLLRLSLPKDGPPLTHLPGQYIDLSIPTIHTVGGFTITSPPQTTSRTSDPYIELAIQKSPSNPPAAYLWRPEDEILNSEMEFKVGGNFIFPPITLSRSECEDIDNVVFVAGGVGVNPVMSMISAMDVKGSTGISGMSKRVRVLYASKREEGGRILFEERLEEVARRWEGAQGVDMEVAFFETGSGAREVEQGSRDGQAVVKKMKGRITHDDLMTALGPEDKRRNIVVYVCGVPDMTDTFVELLRTTNGMEERRVLCEKWW